VPRGSIALFEHGLAGHEAFARRSRSHKVITSKDEIVIGLTDDELAQFEGKDAGGIARMLVAEGSMSVWQYAVHKNNSGELEQAPLRKIGLIASESLRVEPYATPLKVVPIDEPKK
jgi:hypothetical protein